MAQGTRVSRNLFHDNLSEDLFVEVNHGPFLVDNNLFLSAVSVLDMSEGGAYAHNLLTGRIISRPEPKRSTPFHPAHSTGLAGMGKIKGGDNRFYNNIFVGDGKAAGTGQAVRVKPEHATGFGLWVYDGRELPLETTGNTYWNGARPYSKETNHVAEPAVDPKVEVVEEGSQFTLYLNLGAELKQAATALVTTSLLGKAKISGLPYENADGTPLKIDSDYFGTKRNERSPTAGPFEALRPEPLTLKVW